MDASFLNLMFGGRTPTEQKLYEKLERQAQEELESRASGNSPRKEAKDKPRSRDREPAPKEAPANTSSSWSP